MIKIVNRVWCEKNQKSKRQSKIFTLRPFLDEFGLLCVGGRSQEAN